MIDPLGFALENFDAIGGWRDDGRDRARRSTPPARRPAARRSKGSPACARLLLEQPEQFPRTVTEKLLAYALGRRLEYYDRPAVRKIVRDAAANDYRWSSIILGIVKSPTFLTRSGPASTN